MLIKAEKIKVPVFIYVHVNVCVHVESLNNVSRDKQSNIFLFALQFIPFNQFF